METSAESSQGGTAQDCAIELGVLLPGVMPNNPSKVGN